MITQSPRAAQSVDDIYPGPVVPRLWLDLEKEVHAPSITVRLKEDHGTAAEDEEDH